MVAVAEWDRKDRKDLLGLLVLDLLDLQVELVHKDLQGLQVWDLQVELVLVDLQDPLDLLAQLVPLGLKVSLEDQA